MASADHLSSWAGKGPGSDWETELEKRSSRTVLVVDDDASIRIVIRLMLEMEGYDVVDEARDGVEAVARAVEIEPDVIVLDQEMPARRGNEAADMLKTFLPGTKILAFSAVLDAKPEWADGFLRKTDIGEVAEAVDAVMQG